VSGKKCRWWGALGIGMICSFSVARGEQSPLLDQTQIKGLLVFELNDGSLASEASQMNATVVKSVKDGAFELGFNQQVGEMMQGATEEVHKFIKVRHGDRLPVNHKIELAFSNKYSLKDGPSAAVVCALLAESIITGDEIDPGFAATGDMTATGEVLAVGGVKDKLRGARKKGCSLVGIPVSNAASVDDLYILKGIEPLYGIQIFSLTAFEDARQLAMVERSEEEQAALDEFVKVQEVLKKNEKYVSNAKVREKLKATLKTFPNHLSAKLLLLHGAKKGPTQLSLSGSLDGVGQAAAQLDLMLENDSYLTKGGNNDELGKLVFELQDLRTKIDKRTIPYADAYRNLAQFIREVRSRKTWNNQLQREFEAVIAQIKIQRDKLLGDAKIQEELNNS